MNNITTLGVVSSGAKITIPTNHSTNTQMAISLVLDEVNNVLDYISEPYEVTRLEMFPTHIAKDKVVITTKHTLSVGQFVQLQETLNKLAKRLKP